MLLRVKDLKQDQSGRYIVEHLDENNQPHDMALSGDDAAKILVAFDQNDFDLKRYAQAPTEFPVPDSIPVEIDGPEAGVSTCNRCGHSVSEHSLGGCKVCDGRCPYNRDQAYAS